ncbi:TlpA family protein disulfide reductase [Dyadobacter aurulentus]|uniref:TlpA family protein disulfide reductase n=1 Tax=Dyadobacter sp. UC 10 TaxID=2605428 RepID=UPI001788A5A4|nr:TlpA disulfide reductase family protein [Dyadobacter sp. UC 10]
MKTLSMLLFCLCVAATSDGKTNVIISGKVTSDFSKVVLRDFNYFLQEDIIFSESAVSEKDSSFILNFAIDEPRELMILNAPVFVTPGDTIELLTDGFKVLLATGRNKSNYLFFSALKAIKQTYPQLEEKYSNDWKLYREDLYRNYIRNESLRDSLASALVPTDELASYSQQQLTCQYLGILLGTGNARIANRSVRQSYLASLDRDQIARNLKSGQKSAPITQNRAWQEMVDAAILFETGRHATSANKLRDMVAVANKYLDDQHQGIYIVYALERYYREAVNGFESTLVDSLTNIADIKLGQSQAFRSKLLAFKKKINAHRLVLADSVLQAPLRTPGRHTVILDELLEAGQIVVLDFWASWCGPCIQDRKDGAATYALFKENNVSVMSISIDESDEIWLKALQRFSFNHNEFLLESFRLTALARMINLTNIPRTIIVGPNKEVLALDAPRLADTFRWHQLLKQYQTSR